MNAPIEPKFPAPLLPQLFNLRTMRRDLFLAICGQRLRYSTRPRTFARACSTFGNPQVSSTINQVGHWAPQFKVDPKDIAILKNPVDFYGTLLKKIGSAKKRVFLSTLYIGPHETELVETLRRALLEESDLQVYILTDALRGTREAPDAACSASLIAPLAQDFPRRVHLNMFHTPQLHGIRKAIIPRRFNEGWGLQHMKLYGFDDEIIMSGANLSRDYFTNRQDRYMVFKSQPLTDYFFDIHVAVSFLSYKVEPRPGTKAGFALVWPHSPNNIPQPTEDPATFVSIATKQLSKLLKYRTVTEFEDVPSATYVYPISQFTPVMSPDQSTEFPVISRVLSMLGSDKFNWTLTAGYFNVHPSFRAKLLETRPENATIITASPEANGFFKSKGVSGLLPAAYSLLAENFLKLVYAHNRQDRIHLLEWKNGTVNTPEGWSYHAKGLWVRAPGEKSPFLTIVGSSNYTRRAYSHDLESNVVLFTRDVELQKRLAEEVDNLTVHTKEMSLQDYKSEDRKPDWRQKLFVRFMGDRL